MTKIQRLEPETGHIVMLYDHSKEHTWRYRIRSIREAKLIEPPRCIACPELATRHLTLRIDDFGSDVHDVPMCPACFEELRSVVGGV